MLLSILFLFITIHAVTSSDQVSEEDLYKLANANNHLAGRLYPRLIKDNSNNVFFFPLSLMTGLGIMLYGARGNTQQELYSVLGYKAADLAIEKIPPTYQYYLTEELPQNNPNFTYYTLLCADDVLVTNTATLNTKFQEEAQNLYEAKIENVDFSNTASVSENVNNFVKQQTYGKINHIVNNVDAHSSALLVDAVFFKGMWETPFPPFWPFPQLFYSPKGEKEVPFMLVTHSFPYYENNEFQALFLPYIGGFLGLLILEPVQKDGLSEMEKTMTPDKIVEVINHLQPERTLVLLPKFKFQYYRDFSKDFEALGANSTYNGSADFSGMTSEEHISVSGTLHKAALEVDESNQGIGLSVDFAQPISKFFVANNPFMFAVVDIRYNLILALGRVLDV